MNEWVNVVQTLGVPFVVMAAMAFAIWRAFHWFAPIGHELAKKHGSLVEKLETYLDRTSEMLATQAKHLDEQHVNKISKLNDIHTDVRGIGMDVKEIKERVKH